MIGNNIILNIFGHPCVGKSTLVDQILRKQDGIYCVDFDVVKRQLSGYYWKRDREFAAELTHDTLNIVTKSDKPIVALLPIAHNEEEFDFYFGSVRNTTYRLVNIQLRVERSLLIHRYKKRLESINKQNPAFRIKTLDEFIDVLDQPTYVPQGTHFIDSGTLNESEVYDEFLRIVDKK